MKIQEKKVMSCHDYKGPYTPFMSQEIKSVFLNSVSNVSKS